MGVSEMYKYNYNEVLLTTTTITTTTIIIIHTVYGCDYVISTLSEKSTVDIPVKSSASIKHFAHLPSELAVSPDT